VDPFKSGPATPEELGIRSEGEGATPIWRVVRDGEPSEAVSGAIRLYQPSILVVGVKRASESPGPHGTAFCLLASSRVPVLCVPAETASPVPDTDVCVPVSMRN
jgi:hypothetical protein